VGIFTTGIIFSDLMKLQQGLINNYNSVQWKLVNYLYDLENDKQVDMQGFKICACTYIFIEFMWAMASWNFIRRSIVKIT
jgi:hypothetical protein